MPYLVIVLRCLVGVVFLVSSVGKVAGRHAFSEFVIALRQLRMLPASAVSAVATCVVCVEAAIWVLLAIPEPVATTAGFTLAAGLLTVFAVGIVVAMRRGVRAPCRCFGASASLLGPWHVARNVVLAGTAMGAAAVPAAGPVQLGGVVVAVSGGLLLGGLTAVLDDLVDLFRSVDKGSGRVPLPSVDKEEMHDAVSDRGPGSRRAALRT
ncbi:MauE/DoxX family redox-associated membrane protein [Streptomyces avermitilis]|uniref:MauE/DoxX family redox-associated membrane protein n=1 Tax=Streptomyces avermitilis TaxID=33903 RepID=UPI0034056BA2